MRRITEGRDNEICAPYFFADGQVRPPPRQVHGVLPAVPWRRRAQGVLERHRPDQAEAHHSVCRLVPYRIQGM